MLEEEIPCILVELAHIKSGRFKPRNPKGFAEKDERARKIAECIGKVCRVVAEVDLWRVQSWNDGKPSSTYYLVLFDMEKEI
jgi:hypothetical protein